MSTKEIPIVKSGNFGCYAKSNVFVNGKLWDYS